MSIVSPEYPIFLVEFGVIGTGWSASQKAIAREYFFSAEKLRLNLRPPSQ